MNAKKRNINVDRISELPESSIHEQIMSRLSTRNRGRTRVLSKTWYHLNNSYPALQFDFGSFYKGLKKQNPTFSRDSPEFCNSVKSFRKHADNSLNRFSQRDLCLKSLRVDFRFYNYSEYKSDLFRWVESALDCKVEELELCIPRPDKREGSLPQSVYFSATLTTLKLDNCVLDQPLSLFGSLKKLRLSDCRLNKGPLVLNHSDCQALESLVLNDCSGFDSVHIFDHVQLHTVKIQVSIELQFVEITSQRILKFSIATLHKIPRTDIYGCNCLKLLHLSINGITDKQFHDLLSKLPLLEELYVTGWNQLEAMQVSSPRLKTLLVSRSPPLKSIDIKVPTIKNIIFSSCIGEHTEIKVQAGCCLETLMLSSVKTNFNDLAAKFPMLQSLWIGRCCKLDKIEILNPLLKRLHIYGCSELRVVEVASRELEMYCRDREDLEIFAPNYERKLAYEIQRCNAMVEGCCGFVCFKKMLLSLVKDKLVAALPFAH